MATFKAVAFKHHVKSDKTVSIKIRVTHKRKIRYIDTNLVARVSDFSRDRFKLKDPAFVAATNAIILKYLNRINQEPVKVKYMDVDSLVNFISRGEEEEKQKLDFIDFSRKHILKLRSHSQDGTADDYQTALNAFIRYTGASTFNVNDITRALINAFTEYVRLNPIKSNSKMSRAPSKYAELLRALHNEMKFLYNDEDAGVIRIPFSPFRKNIPKRQPVKKRTLAVDKICQLINLSYQKVINSKGTNRFNLAKDCWLLSFYLIGMNSADLYAAEKVSKGWLTYKRMKTSSRREDEALISIKLQPEVMTLLKKYADPSGKRVFNFYLRYKNKKYFNKAINKGLKQVAELIKEKDLEYYSARHSWATIARNKCQIDKHIVSEALNHTDQSMRVTDFYLEKDFTQINEANRRVLDYIKNTKAESIDPAF